MDNFTLLEVNFLYDPDCPSVGRLVGRSVIISSSIYMLLSKQLLLWVPRKFYFFEAGASLILTPSPLSRIPVTSLHTCIAISSGLD